MRKLIAYYSRTGRNRVLAEELRRTIGADIEEIVELKNRRGTWGYLTGGLDSLLWLKTKIKQYELNPSDYALTVIVAPIWFFRIPPPVRTYLTQNKANFRKLAFLSVCGRGDRNTKATAEIAKIIEEPVSAELMLDEEEFDQNKYRRKFAEFATRIISC
ncbi:MAG: hypothetical protein OEV37_01990 [Candidatus Berkelbacteria bacterium]|nr:hypothetical protein [Candidatus Berkelbacteria bacterium]